MLNEWLIEKNCFELEDIEKNGSKYLIGNGFMGYRGTMEEYSSDQLVAVNLAGFFDLAKNSNWRESVNAPNPLYTVVSANGKELNLNSLSPLSHEQSLNISNGLHSRETVFAVDDANITIKSERFVSMKRENIMALKYSVKSDKDITISIKTGIDKNVWDISGKHLNYKNEISDQNILKIECETVQYANKLEVYEAILGVKNLENDNLLHNFNVNLKANEEFEFVKFGGVYHSDSIKNSNEDFIFAINTGYENLKLEHTTAWQEIWQNSDVLIEGDDEAQLALRYSIYHLCSIAPHNTDKCGIPARGLSGQVYKGAAFWDTEMFMLPFFQFTDSKAARNLLKYRVNTLAGAKRKAEEFGHEGAFFAWESQETGDDACTLFNVTDIFTNRPQRTYFKDKQIHVSADIVFAMWDYCRTTGDYSLLVDGGLPLMYECLWFFYTYSVFKPHKNRYEILDVVGPDEYHERVNNNAFTNVMVKHAVDIFISAAKKVEKEYPNYFKECKMDLAWAYDFADKLYVPQPNEKGLIEQFDGYFKLEDVTPEILKTRELKENEYWGGHGLASETRTLKQADVVMMLNVFRNEYSNEVKKANWEFYEPYTEHGSSLSACAYAIVAAAIGNTDWAYKYFMKTATVDLTGNTKQYLGSLYIGGTHPAANGGAWNTAIFGFAGVSFTNDALDISPKLPKNWQSLSFKLNWKGETLNIKISQNNVEIKGIVNSKVTVNGKEYFV
jgi:trehalose/maltose hydrolase-like predicted phosphorylase